MTLERIDKKTYNKCFGLYLYLDSRTKDNKGTLHATFCNLILNGKGKNVLSYASQVGHEYKIYNKFPKEYLGKRTMGHKYEWQKQYLTLIILWYKRTLYAKKARNKGKRSEPIRTSYDIRTLIIIINNH